MTFVDVDALFAEVQPRLARAFAVSYGRDRGQEALSEAMAFAWEHFSEVTSMDNPAGFLFRMGQSRSRRQQRPLPARFPSPGSLGLPDVEPGLPRALEQLTERQRSCVALVHGYGMPHQEVADLLGLSREGVMYAVTAGGPGLVAVGANHLDYYTRQRQTDLFGYGVQDDLIGAADAVVWTSPDGLTWLRVPPDETIFGGDGSQQMFDVTAGGPGLVAVGRDGPVVDGEGNDAVWISPDGFTWSRVPHDEAVFGGPGEQRMVSVTAGGPGLVAVGFDGPADSADVDGAVWTSPDGFTWTRVPHDETVFGGDSRQMMLDVTIGGPGLVAVGTDGHLFKTLDESAADAAVWTSADGLIWSRVPRDEEDFGGPTEQRLVSVTVGGPGLVAVGSECGPGYSCSDAAVWTSPDGFSWSRVPDDEAIFSSSGLRGNNNEAMLSVTAGGPGLVAVGFDSIDDCGWDSAVWTSPDGITWSRVPDERRCGIHGPYDRMLSVTVGPSGLVAVGEEHGPMAAAVWNG